MNAHVTTDAASVKGNWNWGKSIALVYTVFAVATLAFAVFTFTQKVELVSDDYYSKELQYDEHVRRVSNAALLPAPVTLQHESGDDEMRLHFPLSVQQGTVLLYRPSTGSMDRSFALRCDASNTMSIPVRDLPAGEWIVKVEWTSASTPYYFETRFQR